MSDDPNADRIAAADPPIAYPVQIYPSSNYGDKRTCKDSKGNTIPGCQPTDFHPGVDLAAPKGTAVVAPHDGWLLFSGPAGGQAPWAGYGPAVVLLAHDDVSDSWWKRLGQHITPSWLPDFMTYTPGGGYLQDTAQAAVYTVLAHLDPRTLPFERAMDSRVAEVWGRHNVDSHDWRERPGDGPSMGPQHLMTFQPGDGRKEAWSNMKDPSARYVTKGQILGYIGDAGHVHWETRVSPLGTHASQQTINPWSWLVSYKGEVNMPDMSNSPPRPASSSSGAGMLLLALGIGYAISEGK
jgi:murein DD-endopeptidase MepM/ murein hydrolase activator NlpD